MRITLDYEISPDIIPKNYGRGFISLIKKLIEKTDPLLFNCYYEQHKLKPFTFGTYFPKLQGNEGDKLNVGNIVKVNFSTSSIQLATNIYNGFLKVKEHTWQNSGSSINFKPLRAYLQPNKYSYKEEIIVKTLSPLLVNNIGDSNKFLLPGEEGFLEGLEFSVRECAKEFLGDESNFPFKIEVKAWKRRVLYHYKKMPSTIGIFEIKSKPEIIQMIYDVGLGVHRSQGFGMMEVVG
ncbi:crispr-associated protein Cas6 [Melioribacter roseus P3M-2]|uniref:Crispr-associated protein Cas6 n=1 Tax=Melioribacter roseus (strain DSM 23840 / JCM 17771 / VKM B-2668 / P3M-2) TaxID=1191523 RepID=I6ZYF6_MELRP|nr:CRISPR-associated endoribonuclease Cas6 [Melioribacter roseus]AFN74058.1 crispr-associated protein Cas6 [Melioribacter roseus P3M-2]